MPHNKGSVEHRSLMITPGKTEEERGQTEAQPKAENKKRSIVSFVLSLVLVVIAVVYGLAITFAQRSTRKETVISAHSTHPPSSLGIQRIERSADMDPITGTDNGHKWRETSHEARKSFCEDFARRIGKHNWEYYYEAIDVFYSTIDPKILGESIATIVAMASVMPSEEKQRKALANAVSKGRASLRELEIYNYLQSRWNFYEARDGKYISEKHDDVVVLETAKKFGLSSTEVLKVFNKVDKIKLGTD